MVASYSRLTFASQLMTENALQASRQFVRWHRVTLPSEKQRPIRLLRVQVEWVALCTIVSAASAEEKLWFSRARQIHGGVARCLLRVTDLCLQMKVRAASEVARRFPPCHVGRSMGATF